MIGSGTACLDSIQGKLDLAAFISTFLAIGIGGKLDRSVTAVEEQCNLKTLRTIPQEQSHNPTLLIKNPRFTR
jgi:hypothetical protein